MPPDLPFSNILSMGGTREEIEVQQRDVWTLGAIND
jgi:hypothetical protein